MELQDSVWGALCFETIAARESAFGFEDGKIFVVPMVECSTIRIGQKGDDAIGEIANSRPPSLMFGVRAP